MLIKEKIEVPFGDESTKSFVLDYYKLQWERIAHHEDQRLRFSSMIAAGSIAGIGLIARFSQDIDLESMIIACLVISIANLLAIIFSVKSRMWVKYHQKKATQLSEELEPGITDIIKVVEKPDSDKDPFRRELIFSYLHFGFIISSLLLVFVQCVEL
jgi:phosphate/sulfate permease